MMKNKHTLWWLFDEMNTETKIVLAIWSVKITLISLAFPWFAGPWGWIGAVALFAYGHIALLAAYCEASMKPRWKEINQ